MLKDNSRGAPPVARCFLPDGAVKEHTAPSLMREPMTIGAAPQWSGELPGAEKPPAAILTYTSKTPLHRLPHWVCIYSR
jgi:hypothetical protein